MNKPTVGRIVHYWKTTSPNPCAAIVTSVDTKDPMLVNLAVFNSDGTTLARQSVKYVAEHKNYSASAWCWPKIETES